VPNSVAEKSSGNTFGYIEAGPPAKCGRENVLIGQSFFFLKAENALWHDKD
jgi:hypothetical protein